MKLYRVMMRDGLPGLGRLPLLFGKEGKGRFFLIVLGGAICSPRSLLGENPLQLPFNKVESGEESKASFDRAILTSSGEVSLLSFACWKLKDATRKLRQTVGQNAAILLCWGKGRILGAWCVGFFR